MDFNTLRYNLQQPYLQSNWQVWLQFIFGQQINIETQAEKIVVQKGNAKSIERFAAIALSNDRNIAVLDIKTTADIQIARNRVALRDIAFKLIDQDKYHGLLVFYHSDDNTQLDYRLSFISSQTTIDEDGHFIQQSTNAKRYSFILGQNENCTTATLRLLELKSKVPAFKAFETKKEIALKDVTDAFSVEKLNNEFFKKYKDIHYKRFWEYIANNAAYADVLLNKEENEITKQQKPIRDFIKKMLGRIVFLHFLQKKGWMGCPADTELWTGGDKNFMLNLFSNYPNPTNFYSNCLTVLFFQTLNTDRRKKKDVAPNALSYKSSNPANQGSDNIRIPFLNGGLFDDELPQTNHFNFPVEYFKDLFDFFEQYNFTIDENSPEEQEVGIDPEMLGHIFENLLEENKDKGAFYTPKEIVHYMCQESLIQYLRTHLPECADAESQATKAIETFIRKDDIGNRADKKNFIVANAKRIEAILDKVKICDPAIGSGAFPMGMLQEIFKAKTTLDLTLDKAQVKKDIIRNNIYGVDLENGAVDIARLRFWLSLVVDEEVPQPLPNLDYKIMQGNSLLERFEEIDLSKVHTITKTTKVYEPNRDIFGNITNPQLKLTDNTVLRENNLQQLMNDFFIETNPIKKAEKKEKVNQTIHNHIDYNLELWQNALTIQIANAPKLTDPTIKLATKRKIEKLYADLEALNNTRKALHELENKTAKPYFLWHLLFADVFADGGFDIVIGNPPYISVKGISEKEKNVYSNIFDTAKGQFDLYGLFIEKSFELLRKKGILVMITSNTFLNNKDFYELRKKIILESSILSIANLDESIFESAQVDVSILMFKNLKQLDSSIQIFSNKTNFLQRVPEYIQQSKFNNEALFYEFKLNCTRQDFTIIDYIFDSNIVLKEIVDLPRGIELGSNSELIGNKQTIYNRKLLVGKDIKKYQINFSDRYIVFNETDKSNYKSETIYNQNKLLIQRIRNLSLNQRIVATIDYDNYLCTNTLRIGILKDYSYSLKFILVLLNSRLINYLFLKFFLNKDIYAYQLEQIPIAQTKNMKQFEILADYLTFLYDTTQPPVNSYADNTSIAPVFEDVANMMVYELYFTQHIQALEIDVLQFVNTEKYFKPIDTSDNANAAANAKIIGDCYNWLQAPNNEVKKRIETANEKSPNILAVINKATV